MIRLTLLLCAGLYLGLLVLGQDHGQKRYGLLLASKAPQTQLPLVYRAETAPTPAAQPEQQVFRPLEPVMQPAAPEPQLAEVAATSPPDPEPVEVALPEGAIYMAITGANVRGGPGRAFAVLDSLAAGEQVLVLPDDNPSDGWLRIRLEGDGVEGYVAERLLAALP